MLTWSVLRRVVVFVAVMSLIGWTLARLQQVVGHETRPAGFKVGLLHGALMPCAFPLLLAGQNVQIYAELNTGHSYKLGYTMGVNGCGLIFFGFLFTRLARVRRRLGRETAPGGQVIPSTTDLPRPVLPQ